MYDNQCSELGHFREVWFPLALADPAAFHQTLGHSVMHLAHLRQSTGKDTSLAIAHYAAAVRSVNERLADPILGIDDGIIAAIIALACHDVSCAFKPYITNFSSFPG